MALLDPVDAGELELGGLLRLRIAGAESNFAVGLTRLGVPVPGSRGWAPTGSARSCARRWRARGSTCAGCARTGRPDRRCSTSGGRTGARPSPTTAAGRRRAGWRRRRPGRGAGGRRARAPTGITMALGDGPRALVLDVARRAHAAAPPSCSTRTTARRCGTARRPRPPDGPGARARRLVPVRRRRGRGAARRGDARGVLARSRRVAWAAPSCASASAARSWPRAARSTRSRRPVARRSSTRSAPATRSRPASPTGCCRAGTPGAARTRRTSIAAAALRGTGDWETLPRLDDVRRCAADAPSRSRRRPNCRATLPSEPPTRRRPGCPSPTPVALTPVHAPPRCAPSRSSPAPRSHERAGSVGAATVRCGDRACARRPPHVIPPYYFAEATRLERALGVSHVLAQVLVRRGMGDPARARVPGGRDSHPLDAFGGLREARGAILAHVARRSLITVHGDYDADGVCSTAVLVRALRTLGAASTGTCRTASTTATALRPPRSSALPRGARTCS